MSMRCVSLTESHGVVRVGRFLLVAYVITWGLVEALISAEAVVQRAATIKEHSVNGCPNVLLCRGWRFLGWSSEMKVQALIVYATVHGQRSCLPRPWPELLSLRQAKMVPCGLLHWRRRSPATTEILETLADGATWHLNTTQPID